MKVAFVGKGGSGKTTLSSLFVRSLVRQGLPVLAIDADINQHLGVALGLAEDVVAGIPALGEEIGVVKDYLRGDNPRVPSADLMIKTTPPGSGSRLLTIQEDNSLYEHFAYGVDSMRLLVTGPFEQDDLGVKCYHSKVGAVELLLNHLVDGVGEYAVVDMTAGADSFASGLFTKFDVTFVVVEPTLKSLGVYQQYVYYARDYGVRVAAIGNKISSDEDVRFLRDRIGDALLACMPYSNYVRAQEKGAFLPLEQFEVELQEVLVRMRQRVDDTPKDWDTFYRQTLEFHRKNALSWANTALGADLTAQIDPGYVFPALQPVL